MSVPWRVMQLASSSDMGGTERMILFLTEHMTKDRFESHVGCLLGSGELVERAAPNVAGTRHFHYHFPVDPISFWKLVGYLRKNRIDLLHCYGLRADLVGRMAARFGGVRAVVSSIRSIDPWRSKSHSMLDRLTAGNVDLFISNSEAGKQATVAREKFAPGRIEVVYSGIPERTIPREQRSQIRTRLGLNQSAAPVIGVLANLRSMKGHVDIVKAIPQIRGKFPHVRFLFAGRDDSKGEIEKLAYQQGVAESVKFLGYVADTPLLFAAMDIFLLASTWEGLPASIVEAMHARVPIIATNVGGIPELVRHEQDGLLIPHSNHQAIAGAILRLWEHEELRERLVESAAARAAEEFSLPRMVAKTEELYERVLQSKGKPPRG